MGRIFENFSNSIILDENGDPIMWGTKVLKKGDLSLLETGGYNTDRLREEQEKKGGLREGRDSDVEFGNDE